MLLAPSSTQVIMACHITGVYDVNRNNTLRDDDYSLVSDWVDSIYKRQLNGILFHNSLSDETCATHQSETISFIKIVYNPNFNPNVYRYFVYKDFLRKNSGQIQNVFVTDVSDVVVVMNPFTQPIFVSNPNSLFCGDEPKQLGIDWMKAHATHLRSKIEDYTDYEEAFQYETLLNCGVIGGHITVMLPFIEKLCAIHQQYNNDNKTAYTGDMGAFNYLARTQFNNRLIHGNPVNTVFKAYENNRTDCWFRHK